MVVVIRVFHAELAVRVHVTIYHLWVVIVSLRLNLVTNVFLEDIGGLARLVLDSGHHVRPRSQVRILTRFERFELVLPRRHNCLVWIGRTDIVILKPFSAGYPVGRVANLLARHVRTDHSYLLLSGDELRVLLVALGEHLLLVASVVVNPTVLLSRVERYLNAPIGVPYCFGYRFLVLVNQVPVFSFEIQLRKLMNIVGLTV